ALAARDAGAHLAARAGDDGAVGGRPAVPRPGGGPPALLPSVGPRARRRRAHGALGSPDGAGATRRARPSARSPPASAADRALGLPTRDASRVGTGTRSRPSQFRSLGHPEPPGLEGGPQLPQRKKLFDAAHPVAIEVARAPSQQCLDEHGRGGGRPPIVPLA